MRLAFTGGRVSMTEAQRVKFMGIFRDLSPLEFHHGTAEGADADAANRLWQYQNAGWTPHFEIVAHPGKSQDGKIDDSGCARDRELPSETHFARNRALVDSCDALIACPSYQVEIIKETIGGVAYTVNYARKKGKRVIIVWPDGTILDNENASR